MSLRPSLPPAIGQKLKSFFPADATVQFTHVGGGSINDSYCISYGSHRFFCKINSATIFPHLFKREQSGIEWIRKQGVIHTPGIIDYFEEEDTQCLVMEWITEGERTTGFWQLFGEQLAALHQGTNDFFGLHENNYMGSVPQANHPEHSWIDFFTIHRLEPLIGLCSNKALISKKHCLLFDRLYQKLTDVFDAEEKPCPVHGDLWSGNFMCNQKNEPVLIDPAVYYGHRSVDLGMTTLFGGFHPVFYEAYSASFPLPPNYKEQWQVCNLYPLLIHLYLFGSSYLGQIEQTLQQFA
jgi:protein-ribulosamine 3-kinase